MSISANTDKLIVKNALVLASGETSPQPHTDILSENGTIVAVASDLSIPPGCSVIDATGLLITPGLINGHFHSHEHFHKGRFDNLPLELWMHFVRPPVAPPALTPEQVYLRTMIGAIEAIRTGTTFVVDDVNHAPHYSMECIDAVFQAYEDIGLRALVSVSLYDLPFYRAVPFFDEEMPEHLREQLDSQALPNRDRLLAIAHHLAQTRHPNQHRVGYIVAPSAPQRCSRAFLVELGKLVKTYDLPMMLHLLETRLQAVTGQLFYQRSMTEYLAELGILSDRIALQHCVWLTPLDIKLLAQSGASVVYNPLSNLKLGSGRMPVRALQAAGVNIALASDGCGSIDSLNMLAVMQAAGLLNKSPATPPENWVSAEEAFGWATIGGAKAFGFERILGKIAPGYQADFVGYQLNRLSFVPLNHPLRQLVYAETGVGVDLVVVDGVVVMRNGKLAQVNEQALIEAICKVHRQILPAIQASEATVQTFLPYYRQIYNRCLTQPVDPTILSDDLF
jgi:guanine deaminase